MPGAHFLTVDVGAGSLRAGLVRKSGRVAAIATVSLAIDEPQPGWAEIDPEQWWRALAMACARVLRALPRSARVEGICICGLTRTQVLLDAGGAPLGRAIAFRDIRAAKVASEMGGVSSFETTARMRWIERHQPRRFARVAAVAEPKDFLNHRLTGVLAGDTVTSSRGGDPPWMPRALVAPWKAVGVVRSSASPFKRLAGVPVFAGAMDTWASAIGAGAAEPGDAYDVAGTSEAIGLVTERRSTVPGLIPLDWTERAHQIGGPTQAGADCARWCHQTFRVRGTLEDAVERVARGALRSDAPLFLPYLSGERAPVWNSDVRGTLQRISLASSADDFLWSTLEGVAMAVRDILVHAQAGSGVQARALHVCGGGARSDGWCKLKADVTGLPVLRSIESETGLVGGAIASSVGAGLHASIADATAAMVRRKRRFAPDPRRRDAFAARFARYREMKDAALAMSGQP